MLPSGGGASGGGAVAPSGGGASGNRGGCGGGGSGGGSSGGGTPPARGGGSSGGGSSGARGGGLSNAATAAFPPPPPLPPPGTAPAAAAAPCPSLLTVPAAVVSPPPTAWLPAGGTRRQAAVSTPAPAPAPAPAPPAVLPPAALRTAEPARPRTPSAPLRAGPGPPRTSTPPHRCLLPALPVSPVAPQAALLPGSDRGCARAAATPPLPAPAASPAPSPPRATRVLRAPAALRPQPRLPPRLPLAATVREDAGNNTPLPPPMRPRPPRPTPRPTPPPPLPPPLPSPSPPRLPPPSRLLLPRLPPRAASPRVASPHPLTVVSKTLSLTAASSSLQPCETARVNDRLLTADVRRSRGAAGGGRALGGALPLACAILRRPSTFSACSSNSWRLCLTARAGELRAEVEASGPHSCSRCLSPSRKSRQASAASVAGSRFGVQRVAVRPIASRCLSRARSAASVATRRSRWRANTEVRQMPHEDASGDERSIFSHGAELPPSPSGILWTRLDP